MRPSKFALRLIPRSLGGPNQNVYNNFIKSAREDPKFIPHVLIMVFFRYALGKPKGIERNRTPMWDWIKKHKPNRILEIGMGSGVNAKRMIRLAGDCTYFCFDNLSGADWKNYLSLRKTRNTRFYVGDTIETLPRLVGSLPKMDLIFIDGAHDYEHVKNDWENCKKLMHPSTACFFHDYNGIHVRRVVNSIGDEFGIKILAHSCPPLFAIVQRK